MPVWVERVPRWRHTNAPPLIPGRNYLLADITDPVEIRLGVAGTVTTTADVTDPVGIRFAEAATLKLPEDLVDFAGNLDLAVDGSVLVTPTVGKQVVQAGQRKFSFRYELLDSGNATVGDLTTVTEATVSQDWLADIKRKLDLTMADGDPLGVDWLSDRVRPWVRLHLPPYGDDDYVEWPQGVFLLSSPTRYTDDAGGVWRKVTGYDQLQVFTDDKVADRYTVTEGAVYTSAVSTLLGSISKSVAPSSATLPTDREWDPGTSKLRIINDLLASINYQSLSFDEYGVAVVQPYTAPSDRASEYTYADGESALMLPRVDQELDLFDVANRWVLVVSNPDQSALKSTYLNQDPASPTSTVRRGRTITDFRTEQDAADQASLDAKVARLAFEASQVYEKADFTTGLMPIHSGNDVYRVVFTPLAVNAKFAETSWSMPLKVGATMQHKARRVVRVDEGG